MNNAVHGTRDTVYGGLDLEMYPALPPFLSSNRKTWGLRRASAIRYTLYAVLRYVVRG